MRVSKPDVIEASGSLQVCAGQKSGSKAAIHAMRTIFYADETDAVLLIDASNAFNALNRATALHNIRVLCPVIATYAINTYRRPARLFITGGEEINSAEGTTQGDPLAMSLYAISLQPLITGLQLTSSAKQCWFADDATGAGSLVELKKWWDELNNLGPDLGYYPNANKCWLVIKPDKESDAKELFADFSINISTQGQKHLGAALGSRSFLEEYVNAEMYPECVIASWDALILLLHAENIERRVQLDAEKKIECLCKLQTPGKNRYANLCFVKTIFIN